jgi:two-component system, LytTR family, sensor kinase
MSATLTEPGRSSSTPRIERSWLLAGVVGWAAVFVIATVDVGFQGLLQGRPFLASWTALGDRFLVTLAGALLTPLVFLAFARLAPISAPLRARVLWYTLVGIGFWLGWAMLHALLARAMVVRDAAPEVAFLRLLFDALAGHAFNSLILFGVMVTLYELVQYSRVARRHEVRSSRLRSELSLAEMTALRAQLDPHFLFNTLHVVSGLMGRDVRAARRVLADLGELLRGSLATNGARLVPLADEMRLVERYTGIQKARFGERLDVDFDVAPDTLTLRVPPLLLQPLVENAIQHGVARLAEGGRVRVSAVTENGLLHLTVGDTGSGFGGSSAPVRERIGIGGTRARLWLLFGEKASLDFSYPAPGFAVRITLPAVEGESHAG